MLIQDGLRPALHLVMGGRVTFTPHLVYFINNSPYNTNRGMKNACSAHGYFHHPGVDADPDTAPEGLDHGGRLLFCCWRVLVLELRRRGLPTRLAGGGKLALWEAVDVF